MSSLSVASTSFATATNVFKYKLCNARRRNALLIDSCRSLVHSYGLSNEDLSDFSHRRRPEIRRRLIPINLSQSRFKLRNNIIQYHSNSSILCVHNCKFTQMNPTLWCQLSSSAGKREDIAGKSKELKENIFTIPNLLTVSRIALSPVLAYVIVSGYYRVGLAIFVYAAITDLLDGWIARRFVHQQSALGSALDPLADKILIGVLTISLTYVGLIPMPLTVLMILRDIGLATAGFVMRYITMESPKTLSRYFDVSAPSVQLKPTTLSKFNTAVQLCMLGLSLTAPVFDFENHAALVALWYFTAATTISSGASYLIAKDTYEVLNKRKR